MRSTTLKGEPILHIHSLRYYLYTIYIVLTLIHVYDAWFDIWLMIWESPWDEALLLSTSIMAVALVSNGSKLGGALAGLILSGEDFFFFLFSFRFLSLGAEWWELIEGFGPRTSLYLTDICKSPISRGCISWTGDTGWLQHHRGCVQPPREECVSVYSRMCRPCLGNVNDRYGTETRQRLLSKSTTVQVISEKKGSRLWCCCCFFLFFLWSWRLFSNNKTDKDISCISFLFFLEKVPAFSTEDAEERRQRKKEIICVDGAGEKKNNPSNNL